MFTYVTIGAGGSEKNIVKDYGNEETDYNKPALHLKLALAADLIAGLALLVIGSLVAANIITIGNAAAAPAMIAIGAFQLSPLFFGSLFACMKNHHLVPALRVLGLTG